MYSTAIKKTTCNNTINFLQTLIKAKSITPNDAGTLAWLTKQLRKLGFEIKMMNHHGVSNLIAKRTFSDGPNMAFIGHVDVVPASSTGWHVAPFSGDIVDGFIYGRGAADMKGGIAAMLSATKELIEDQRFKAGSLYWLITSDEEGEAEFGSKLIAEYLERENIVLDACLVGEPTADTVAGDTIKNGRRGALSGRIYVKGKAGHVAYPENSINAAHLAGEVINYLANITWDKDEAGSKTGLQVTGVQVNNSVDNIIPDNCEVTFNVSYSHGYNGQQIIIAVEQVLKPLQQILSCYWERPCEPYYTGQKDNHCFLTLVKKSIYEATGQYPKLTTAGGTSDGRFFSNEHTQVIECGVANSTIHQINERVEIADLLKAEEIYQTILKNYFIN